MTTKEAAVREYCYALGDGDSIGGKDVPAFCPPVCEHPDCRMAKAILAVLDPKEVFEPDDRPGLKVLSRDRVVNALHRALKGE